MTNESLDVQNVRTVEKDLFEKIRDDVLEMIDRHLAHDVAKGRNSSDKEAQAG